MISVIIPSFNEALQLPATLLALRAQSMPFQLFVVDARSTDETRAVAADFGAQIIDSPRRQRAAQMNSGAQASSGDVLLFLHADTRLAPGALAKIVDTLQRPAVLGGGFARRYDSPSAVLSLTCALAEVRTRACGWFLGDQAMFARRSAFEKLGGFREWDAFEDLDFARRLARAGRVVTLRPPVISAARRFATRGAVRTTWNDLLLTARYLFAGRRRVNEQLAKPRGAAAATAP